MDNACYTSRSRALFLCACKFYSTGVVCEAERDIHRAALCHAPYRPPHACCRINSLETTQKRSVRL